MHYDKNIETAYNNVAAYAEDRYTAAIKQAKRQREDSVPHGTTSSRKNGAAHTYIEYQVASNDLFSAKFGLARAKV